jgi:hypothetical protein
MQQVQPDLKWSKLTCFFQAGFGQGKPMESALPGRSASLQG